jgi:integrase
VLDLAIDKDLITKNPARSKIVRLTMPKQAAKPDKSVFSPRDLPRLLAQLNERDELILRLAITSPRPNEIFAIRGADVGLRWINVSHALSRKRDLKTTKNSKGKYIVLGPELARKLHQWIADRQIGPHDFLFTTKFGKPIGRDAFLRRRLRPAAKRAKIATPDVDFQMLRRSYATLATALGQDIKSTQAQMGHERPDMSMIEYAQPVDDLRLQQAEHMKNGLLGKEPMPSGSDRKAGLGPGELRCWQKVQKWKLGRRSSSLPENFPPLSHHLSDKCGF